MQNYFRQREAILQKPKRGSKTQSTKGYGTSANRLTGKKPTQKRANPQKELPMKNPPTNPSETKMNESNEKCEKKSNCDSATPVSTLAERLKRISENYLAAPEPVYACVECKDAGYVPVICQDGHELWAECKCRIRKMYERICANAGFNLAQSKTLADYQNWNETAQFAKMKAEDYIRDFDTIRRQERNWFIVSGQSGSGKTMLGRAIVKALIEKSYPVRAKAVKYYEMMQVLKANSNAENYGKILDRYTECEVLFIDDLLKEKATYGELTEADIKHLFAVIDRRYDARRPTIISTECEADRLSQLNEAIYGRMIERAYAEIIFEGKENNYRKIA